MNEEITPRSFRDKPLTPANAWSDGWPCEDTWRQMLSFLVDDLWAREFQGSDVARRMEDHIILLSGFDRYEGAEADADLSELLNHARSESAAIAWALAKTEGEFGDIDGWLKRAVAYLEARP